jgi:tRNA threonylcarbamoyladenosine biosynthesis protein TsaB
LTLVLAVDTATDYGSVAVGEPGEAAAELEFTKYRHASGLMPAIVEILGIAGRNFGDLTHIVVADGPGSFTGLRIGFSTVCGVVRELPALEVYSVPSLLSLAYGARRLSDGAIAALYDALRGDVFGAVYSFDRDSVCAELSPTIGTVESLRKRCQARPSLVVGEGALLYGESSRDWSGCDPVGPPDLVPRASFMIDLLNIDGAANRIHDLGRFEPQYGRLAEAQVRMEQVKKDLAGGN